MSVGALDRGQDTIEPRSHLTGDRLDESRGDELDQLRRQCEAAHPLISPLRTV